MRDIQSAIGRGPKRKQLLSGEREIAEYNLSILRVRSFFFRMAFVALVILPTSLGAIYFWGIASKRYVSEAEFIVRGVSSQRATGLDILFRTFGISRTVDDSNVVQNYLLSRDAVRALEQRMPVREIFTRPDADWLSRFPRPWRNDTFEALYSYYEDRVTVSIDSRRGIMVLKVSTFRPDDSRLLGKTLLTLAEEMVNRMNDRARADTVSETRRVVTEAEIRLVDVQRRVTFFRNTELIVDPIRQSTLQLGTIASLAKELAQVEAQLGQTSKLSPSSPALSSLEALRVSLHSQIAAERNKLAGDDKSLASKLAIYEQLALERELADRSLTSATTALEIAQQEARRKQIYIEEIVTPSLPDESLEPRRTRLIATVLVFSLASFAVAWILLVGARDHAQ